MDAKQVRVHDLVRKVNTAHLGLVDRTDKEVNSHVPKPQADYVVDIRRHSSVSKDDFKTFMRHGKPPLRTALVYWDFGATVELISTRFLEVINRTIECGEVVKKVGESRAAMSGVVIEREVFHTLGVIDVDNPLPAVASLADGLERCFPHRLNKQPGNDLSYSRSYVRGDIVLYDGWFGDVYDVFEEVIVWFSDGRIVAFEDIAGIQNVRPDPTCAGELLDVGYIVKVPASFIAAKGRFVASTGEKPVDPTGSRGIVYRIKVNSIGVNWRSRRLGDIGTLNQPHPILDFAVIRASEVRRYGYCKRVRPANAIAGKMDAEFSFGTDVTPQPTLGPFKPDIHASGADQPAREAPQMPEQADCLNHEIPNQEDDQPIHSRDMRTFVVIGVSSNITVRWQDQSVSTHASKDLLADEEFEDGHELWPYCLVAPLRPASPPAIWRPSRIGVVQSVVSADRIAQVLWKDTQEIEYISGHNEVLILLPLGSQSIFPLTQRPQGSAYPEEVSLYDVGHVPDLSLQVLDLVMIIPSETSVLAATDGPSGSTQSEARYDWIGHVVDRRPDGMVVVRMGALSVPEDRLYAPDRLKFLLSREDILDLIEGGASGDEHSGESGDEDWEDSPRAAIAVWYENDQGERISPATSEDDGWSTADDSVNGDDVEMEDVSSVEQTADDAEAAAGFGGSAQAPQLEPNGQNGYRESNEESSVQDVEISSSGVPQPRRLSIRGGPPLFDILDSQPPSAHAFITSNTDPLTGTQMRRIRREHSILSSSLPEGVYVRSWESRLDLFRVLIIGPPDTPYEFAPFMIDFHLPSAWPNKPPKAFFHSWASGTSSINPNLYQDGKICLSLLNTWNGTEKSEEWSPKDSTLYQVLLSIQSLVLVKEPYFNEAGYDVLVGSDEAVVPSRQYSEWVYFNSREYIRKMTEFDFEPFKEVAHWLYRSDEADAPKLLTRSIEAIKDILGFEGRKQQLRGSLLSVSKGALPMFKRSLAMLQSLADCDSASGGASNEATGDPEEMAVDSNV